MHPRVYTDLWVQAHVRRCSTNNIPAYIIARGDAERGGILLKVNGFERGVTLLQPITAIDGSRVWMRISGPEPIDEKTADETVMKRRNSDPDLWVVEIEDQRGTYELGEPIED